MLAYVSGIYHTKIGAASEQWTMPMPDAHFPAALKGLLSLLLSLLDSSPSFSSSAGIIFLQPTDHVYKPKLGFLIQVAIICLQNLPLTHITFHI